MSAFQEFWTCQRDLAAADRPVELRQCSFPASAASYYELSFPGTDGTPLHARYIRPASPSPAPAVLMYHDYGRGVRGWHHMTRFAALGCCVVALENRAPFLDVCAGWRKAPEGLAAAQLYTDAMTAAYAARTLPGVDPERLILWGEGLGGGLAIAAAAMVPGVIKCAALNPLPADFKTVWEQGCGTGFFAGMSAHFRDCDPAHQEAEAFFAAMSYLDCARFAEGVRCPLLLGTGAMDALSPARAQQAAADGAAGPKTHLIYPKYEHERINFFENELLKFFHL